MWTALRLSYISHHAANVTLSWIKLMQFFNNRMKKNQGKIQLCWKSFPFHFVMEEAKVSCFKTVGYFKLDLTRTLAELSANSLQFCYSVFCKSENLISSQFWIDLCELNASELIRFTCKLHNVWKNSILGRDRMRVKFQWGRRQIVCGSELFKCTIIDYVVVAGLYACFLNMFQ